MTLQAKIEQLVRVHKMTQQQIADECGTTQPTISGIQRGERLRTSYEIGVAIDKLYASKNRKTGK